MVELPQAVLDEPVQVQPPADSVGDSMSDSESTMVSSPVPSDMPPPVAPNEAPDTAAADLGPQALKALTRQQQKEAKAASRREAREARDAARRAKAAAKAAARTGRADEADPTLADSSAGDESPRDDIDSAAAPEADQEVAETAEVPAVADTADTADLESTQLDIPRIEAEAGESLPTDPRARAAARVQRRLGRDADKLSAAEARARAREEARQRRTQAKETRPGVVAEEPVVREPDEDLQEVDVSDTVVFEPVPGPPVVDEPAAEPAVAEQEVDEAVDEEPAADEAQVLDDEPDVDVESMPPPTLADAEPAPDPEVVETAVQPAVEEPTVLVPVVPDSVGASKAATRPSWAVEKPATEGRSPLASIAGAVGLVALGISVLLAVGALLVAVGVNSGGLFNALESVANALVGPLENAFDFGGASAERKEHFLAWGAGSILYLLLSFVGQAVQRANSDQQQP